MLLCPQSSLGAHHLIASKWLEKKKRTNDGGCVLILWWTRNKLSPGPWLPEACLGCHGVGCSKKRAGSPRSRASFSDIISFTLTLSHSKVTGQVAPDLEMTDKQEVLQQTHRCCLRLRSPDPAVCRARRRTVSGLAVGFLL